MNLIIITLILLLVVILPHLSRSLLVHDLLVVSTDIFLSGYRFSANRRFTAISALGPRHGGASNSRDSSFSIWRLVDLNFILINFESINSELWLGDLDWNLACFQNLFGLSLLLFQSLRHNSVSWIALFLDERSLLLRDLRNSHTVVLVYSFDHSWVIYLLKLSLLLSSHSIDIVSQEFLVVVSRIHISFPVSMESWFTEVSCERRISQPSSCGVDLGCFLLESLLLSSKRSLFLLLWLIFYILWEDMNSPALRGLLISHSSAISAIYLTTLSSFIL